MATSLQPSVPGPPAVLCHYPLLLPKDFLCVGEMLRWRGEGFRPLPFITCIWGATAMSHDPPKATQLMRGPAGPGVQGSSLLAETTAHALPPSFEPSGCSPLSESQFSHLNWVLHGLPRSCLHWDLFSCQFLGKGEQWVGSSHSAHLMALGFCHLSTPHHHGSAGAKRFIWLSENQMLGCLNGFPGGFCLCCHSRKDFQLCGLEEKTSSYAF